MGRTVSRNALVCLALTVMVGCGDDDDSSDGGTCEAPSGMYLEQVEDATGNCMPEIVNALATTSEVEVPSGFKCGEDSVTWGEQFQLEGGVMCHEEFVWEFEATREGFEDSQLFFFLTCDGAPVCEHTFYANYTRL